MDAAAEALVPPMPRTLEGPVVMFDHHAAHDDFGDVILREADACATGVLVVRMMRELGLEKVPPSAAKGIYAAIVADTGGFRYEGTDPEVLRLAAELLEAGAEAWTTAYHLFEDWRPARMRLLGAIIDGMEMELGGRVAVLTVTRAMLEETGADDEMVEGMVNYGRMLEGVEVALLVWELPSEGEPETKVSLRSSGRLDVSGVATALGGGGHRSAAGSNVRAPLEVTRRRALERIVELLEGAER
jgi:phosphoesterase RecJ-like protein